MHPRDEKEHLRQAIKERLSHQSDNERHAESRTVCREILKLLPKEPITIAAYFPLKDEVDVRPLLLTLFQKGCDVYLPRFEGRLVFRKAHDLKNLPAGQFSIPEPLPSSPLLDPKNLNIALIPGRAFDRQGHRLGRGNGGYDIWIREQRKKNPSTHFWGVCLEAQLAEKIPMEEHDETVDAVVTARGQLVATK